MHRPLTRPRRGIAMMVALLGLVVVGALVATAYFSSTQEHRLGRNTLVAQRAFAIAEYGLNSEVGKFDRKRYLAGAVNFMKNGDVDDKPVYIAQGDTARVKITRLNDFTFWLVSEGSASMGDARLKSTQRANALVRIAYPTVATRGAITTAGDVVVTGNGKIYGKPHPEMTEMKHMNAWSQCSSLPVDSVYGVSVGLTDTVTTGPNNIEGYPSAFEKSAAAEADSTYIKYGSETWNSLVANADIRATGLGAMTTMPVIKPTHTADDQQCNYADQSNWGEPWREDENFSPYSYKPKCKDYFPIVYVQGDAWFSGGRGQGILIVDGDLKYNGLFQWYGLILVKNEVLQVDGSANIFGAIMARSASVGVGGDGGSDVSTVTGAQKIFYSRCALESALRGSAVLTRVPQRSWAQFY